MLEALFRLVNLQTEAGFTSGTFNAQTLIVSDHGRVIDALQSLFKMLSPLIGVRIPADNPNPPIGTTVWQITSRVTMYQFHKPINDSPNSEHTTLFRYTSAESEEETTNSATIGKPTGNLLHVNGGIRSVKRLLMSSNEET